MIVAALFITLASCTTVSWVNDISAAPDGQSVTVVGAEWRFGLVPEVVRPLRWQCLRGADGKLSCKPDASTLPRMN